MADYYTHKTHIGGLTMARRERIDKGVTKRDKSEEARDAEIANKREWRDADDNFKESLREIVRGKRKE
jgi:hypothetical protein